MMNLARQGAHNCLRPLPRRPNTHEAPVSKEEESLQESATGLQGRALSAESRAASGQAWDGPERPKRLLLPEKGRATAGTHTPGRLRGAAGRFRVPASLTPTRHGLRIIRGVLLSDLLLKVQSNSCPTKARSYSPSHQNVRVTKLSVTLETSSSTARKAREQRRGGVLATAANANPCSRCPWYKLPQLVHTPQGQGPSASGLFLSGLFRTLSK